jgi:hypothetical protein
VLDGISALSLDALSSVAYGPESMARSDVAVARYPFRLHD